MIPDEIIIRQREDGTWEEHKPYMTVEFETEEDFKYFEKVLEDRKRMQWIPCSERLPVPNEYDETGKFFKAYLVQTKSNTMHTALWDGTYWTIWTRGIVIDKVIAWMPLPEPYKESED